MKRKFCTQDKLMVDIIEYILCHIIFGTAVAVNIYLLLPIIIPIAENHKSLINMIFCMVVSSGVGICINVKYKKTFSAMLVNVLLGAGAYVVMTIGCYKMEIIRWLIGIFSVITLISLYKIVGIQTKRTDKKIKDLICQAVWTVWRNAGIISSLALVIISVAVYCTPYINLVRDYYNNTGVVIDTAPNIDYAVEKNYDEKYGMRENLDVIKKVRHNSEFQQLDYEEKCEVVTAIVHEQAYHLGLCKINVEFERLNYKILGKYDHIKQTITINKRALEKKTNKEILTIIFHEIRHCIQFLLIESYETATSEQRNLYIYTHEGVSDWIEDLKNPTTENDSDFEYRGQSIEIDARSWSESQVKNYLYKIDMFLKDQGKPE